MKTIDWSQKFDFGGPRTSGIQAVFIHTTENIPGTPAENVAQYQLNSRTGSYHRLFDREKTLIENTDDWTTWSTANRANFVGLHGSFVARAAMSRAQWLNEDTMLEIGAANVAEWCKRHNIPPRFVNAKELLAGTKGISTHDEARKAWGVTDHTDPGPNFPWPEFLAKVKKHMAEKETSPMTDNAINRILHELTYRFPSRVVGSTFKDTLVGYILEIDRKVEDLHQDLKKRTEGK